MTYFHNFDTMSESLLFNIKKAMFQLHHGERQVSFRRDDDDVRF